MSRTKNVELVPIKDDDIEALTVAARKVNELTLVSDDDPFAFASVIGMAKAMSDMRRLLTEAMMAPIMELQGNTLGFLTDKKDNGKYAVDVVRDVTIAAAGVGARMINNEVNIIKSNMYLTKNYFNRLLDSALKRENWKLVHGIPQIHREGSLITGASVKTLITWKEEGTEQSEELLKRLRGDKTTSFDNYHGRMDRKAAAWLLGQVTGKRYSEGDIDDDAAIPTNGTSTKALDQGTGPEEMASKEAVEWLETLCKNPSLDGDDFAIDVHFEIENPVTKRRSNILHKKLKSAIKVAGGTIPEMTAEKVKPDEKVKPVKPVKEKEKEPVKEETGTQEAILLQRILLVAEDKGVDALEIAQSLYENVVKLEDQTFGTLTEVLKELKKDDD